MSIVNEHHIKRVRTIAARVVIVSGLIAWARAAHCQPLSDAECTEEAKIALAQCAVAEVGIDRPREQDALLWTLRNGWRARLPAEPDLAFADHVRAACSIFRSRIQQQRRPWILELTLDGRAQPLRFPINASWIEWSAQYRALLSRIDRWLAGYVPDPCGGAQWWGQLRLGDHPRGRMQLAPCSFGKHGNQFYRLRRGKHGRVADPDAPAVLARSGESGSASARGGVRARGGAIRASVARGERHDAPGRDQDPRATELVDVARARGMAPRAAAAAVAPRTRARAAHLPVRAKD
jgi:hypothetical protein